jgi:hypothetical protein
MPETENNETYLGDGLYVSFDGFQICLRAPRIPEDHAVFLDQTVWGTLTDYVNRTVLAQQQENSHDN